MHLFDLFLMRSSNVLRKDSFFKLNFVVPMRVYVKLVFLLVLVHNGIAFAAGWFFSKAVRLDRKDSISICIETGIQNSGLGLIIIYNFYDGMGSMVLVAAWWAIWHLIAGFVLVGIINYRSSVVMRRSKFKTLDQKDI